MLLGKIHSVSRRKLNHFYFFWGVVIAVIFGYFRIKAANNSEKATVSLLSPPKSKGHELIISYNGASKTSLHFVNQ